MSVSALYGQSARLTTSFLQVPFSATEPDGSMAGVRTVSEVAFRATAEVFCFARPQTISSEVGYD